MKAWDTIQIPLAGGLDTNTDRRAASPPSFDLLQNAEWEEPGGLQLRKPFVPKTQFTDEAGPLLSDVRKVVGNGDELLVFTKEKLYSYSQALGVWVFRGTHLATKIDEETVFADAGDQVDADRCELGGVVFYTWFEMSSNLVNARGYIAAKDKASGAVLLAPTIFSNNATHIRLVALATRVMLVYGDGGQLYFTSLDPVDPTDLSNGNVIFTSGIGSGPKYDAVQIGTSDTLFVACTGTTTTSYKIARVTAGGSVTTSSKARTSDAAIAVSCEPTGTNVQVIRADAGNIKGDLLVAATFADVYTNQAVGTTPGSPGVITACHRSVQDSGAYRCYAFWEYAETTAGAVDWYTQSNWVATDNTLGTAATFMPRWAPRARPFDRDGRIYVWGAFIGKTDFHIGLTAAAGTALEASYFLLRDDAFLVAKAASCVAGAGHGTPASDGDGWIAGSQSIGDDQYAFAGVVCRKIEVGDEATNFASRSPRDIIVTFDAPEARRTARLGRTLYIAGGELLQYDGEKITEVGFHHCPWFVFISSYASTAIPVGTYAYKFGWRAQNARGELERSNALCVGDVTLTASAQALTFAGGEALYLTHKTSVAWEAWRTEKDPEDVAPFYLITSKDPFDDSNPNRYMWNEPSGGYLPDFKDELTDEELLDNELSPWNDGVSESVAPPPCSIIIASSERLFLAGIPGDPHRIWYSKLRADNEVASFFDGNTCALPSTAGAITGMGILNETLIVFTLDAIYALAGDGFDNAGGGSNFGPARILSTDCGAVSHESIALTPTGLIFKSQKGWYLLDRGWQTQYIGRAVSRFDADEVLSVDVLEKQHQVRCLTDSRMLVLDYSVKTRDSPEGVWSEWTIPFGVSSCLFQGTHYYATDSDVREQNPLYGSLDYGLDVELAWIKLNDLQGAGSVRWLSVLGEYRAPHRLRIRIARDYQQDGAGNWSYYQDETWTPTPTVVGGPEQVRVGPRIPKCQAIKVRITVLESEGDEGTHSEALKLTGLALEVGIDRGINKRLPAAQKT